jgi:hypothetical protein
MKTEKSKVKKNQIRKWAKLISRHLTGEEMQVAIIT